MNNDNRDPVTCGCSIGFDGIYVCRVRHIPCDRVKECPVKEVVK